MKRTLNRYDILIFNLLVLFLLAGCAGMNPTERSVLTGTAIGAGTGAVVGMATVTLTTSAATNSSRKLADTATRDRPLLLPGHFEGYEESSAVSLLSKDFLLRSKRPYRTKSRAVSRT